MALGKWLCCLTPMGTAAVTGNYSMLRVSGSRWLNMSCEDCNIKFGLLKRKRTCFSCGKNFCSSCLKKGKAIEKSPKCHRCQVFSSVPINRSSVFELRVKDLRWYLEINNIPTEGCKEKAELVELVINHASLKNASTAYPQNYERHTIRPEDQKVESYESSPVFSHEGSSQDHSRENMSPRHAPSQSSLEDNELEDGFTFVDVVNEDPITEVPDANLVVNDNDVSGGESQVSEKVVYNDISSCPVTVDDITNIEQISNLTVMQMKLILARSFVGFKGCCEKQELQDKVRKLWEQKQETKDASISDENLCKICMEAPIDSVLLDCGHLVTCTECGKQLSECPICRQYVVRVVHTFKA